VILAKARDPGAAIIRLSFISVQSAELLSLNPSEAFWVKSK
jgi:hypothetical protein